MFTNFYKHKCMKYLKRRASQHAPKTLRLRLLTLHEAHMVYKISQCCHCCDFCYTQT